MRTRGKVILLLVVFAGLTRIAGGETARSE